MLRATGSPGRDDGCDRRDSNRTEDDLRKRGRPWEDYYTQTRPWTRTNCYMFEVLDPSCEGQNPSELRVLSEPLGSNKDATRGSPSLRGSKNTTETGSA